MSDATVSYGATAAGSTATGVCASGYAGSPSRICTATGVWLAPTGVACIRGTCTSYNDGTATFPATLANTAGVTGVCNAGYAPVSGSVAPTRNCSSDGTWSTPINNCVRTCCHQGRRRGGGGRGGTETGGGASRAPWLAHADLVDLVCGRRWERGVRVAIGQA